ncbi:hypothetical protein O4H61_12210 [Roseovarius aestuarii]|nr:hypothetical protein [Roseovarius aestuarii]
MQTFVIKFLRDEDGAITVDWVVLTAAVVGLAVGAIATARVGINTAASTIQNGVADSSIGVE